MSGPRLHSALAMPGPDGRMLDLVRVYDDALEVALAFPWLRRHIAAADLCRACTPGVQIVVPDSFHAAGLDAALTAMAADLPGIDTPGVGRYVSLCHDDDCPRIGEPMMPDGPKVILGEDRWN